jgi:putative ABC transport system permease protein
MGMTSDLRFAVRMMRRNLALTLTAILTIAVGVGAAVAVFSLFEATVLRRLPYENPDRLCMLWSVEASSRRGMNSTYFDFRDWQAAASTFDSLAAFRAGSFNLGGDRGPEQVSGLETTPGLLETLGVRLIAGRSFRSGEDDLVVIGHALWLRRYGGNPTILGQSVRVDGMPRTVVGVLPAGFYFPPVRFAGRTELLIPHKPQLDRSGHYLQVVGRLKKRAGIREAQADMDRVAASLDPLHAERGEGILVDPIDRYTKTMTREVPGLLLGAVGLLLLVACANVAHLLLYQASARRQELAVRRALGASRRRLMRQLLTESLLLSGIGSAVGLALAVWSLPLIVAAAPERTALFTRLADTGLRLNTTVLLFSVAASLATAALFGLLPAWRSTRPASGLARSRRRAPARAVLLIGQVAFSFVLVTGAGLMIRSLVHLLTVDLGFHPSNVLTLATDLPPSKYADDEAVRAFARDVMARVKALPGVAIAAAASDLPLTGDYTINGFQIDGQPATQAQAAFHSVTPEYLKAMGIPLMGGRALDARDRAGADHGVAVVSQALARRYWPHDNPVGRTIAVPRAHHEVTPEGWKLSFDFKRVEIVGLVGDVRTAGVDAEPRADLYIPFDQRPSRSLTLIVRAEGPPAALAPALTTAVWSVDPDQPVTDVKTMDEWIAADVAPRRFVLVLLGAFAVAALGLALAGIYGVTSFSVAERTHELAVRIALGAGPRSVAWSVVRATLLWLVVGGVVGLGGALALGRLLSRFLFQVRPADLATLLAVGVLLVGGGLAANIAPIRRALRVDPASSLRES